MLRPLVLPGPPRPVTTLVALLCPPMPPVLVVVPVLVLVLVPVLLLPVLPVPPLVLALPVPPLLVALVLGLLLLPPVLRLLLPLVLLSRRAATTTTTRPPGPPVPRVPPTKLPCTACAFLVRPGKAAEGAPWWGTFSVFPSVKPLNWLHVGDAEINACKRAIISGESHSVFPNKRATSRPSASRIMETGRPGVCRVWLIIDCGSR